MESNEKQAGMKDDTGKLDWDAIPLKVLEALVPAFEAGLRKYARHNCAEPFKNPRQRFFAAMMRHAKECQLDPQAWNEKDHCSHAASMAFNAVMYNHHCSGVMRGEEEVIPTKSAAFEEYPVPVRSLNLN